MFMLIEIDLKWTVGLDWHKHTKGIRLGWFAFHIFFIEYEKFMGLVSENYHQEKLKSICEEV